MTQAELPPEDRTAEFEAALMDLLDTYGDEAAKLIKKGVRRKHAERAKDVIRLQYAIAKDMVSVFSGTSGQVSRSEVELIIESLHPDLNKDEIGYHAYAVLQEMERDSQLVYTGSHYKVASWLDRQQLSDEYVSTHPYLMDKARKDQQEANRLAQLASRNTDGFAPAEESMGSLGDLTSGQAVPDSQP